MKIAMIGSTQYQDKFNEHAEKLRAEGHEVKIPAFDHHLGLDALGVCAYNRDIIAWADRVDMIWDNRSSGTVFDFGMVFAMKKPFQIVYLESKTFQSLMESYSRQSFVVQKEQRNMNACPKDANFKCPFALSDESPLPCYATQEQCDDIRERLCA